MIILPKLTCKCKALETWIQLEFYQVPDKNYFLIHMEEYLPENNQDWEKHWMGHLLCQILKFTKMFTSIQVSVGTEMTTMLWNKITQKWIHTPSCLVTNSLSALFLLGYSCQTPLSMGFSKQDTGVDCHSLLQGIFPAQRLNLGLLLCRQILYHLSHKGSPCAYYLLKKKVLDTKV